MVVHTLSDEKQAPVLEKRTKCDLPALWKPRGNQFFGVDALSVLGTGKIDLCGVKTLAASLDKVAVS